MFTVYVRRLTYYSMVSILDIFSLQILQLYKSSRIVSTCIDLLLVNYLKDRMAYLFSKIDNRKLWCKHLFPSMT